jgi:hypothetical protein
MTPRGIIVAAGLVMLCASCGDPADETSSLVVTSTPAATPTTEPPEAERTSAAEEATGGDEAAWISALSDIDPGLTVNHDRAVRRGARVCDRLATDGPTAATIEYARLEFDGGNASVDTATARQIVAATQQLLC